MAPSRPDIEWNDIAGAFLDTHSRVNNALRKTVETASFLFSLIEICSEKGLISVDELDARQRVIADRLEAQVRNDGVGVKLQDPEFDKYFFTGEVEIDCESRLNICRAACCKLTFALSKQDIQERVVHWNLSDPYLIAHSSDGYCVHLDKSNCHCTIREHRPVPCRAYDCRNEKRIWIDFEKRIVNPAVNSPDWPRCEPVPPSA